MSTEKDFLNIIEDVLLTTTPRKNRTSSNTLNIFGRSLRFDVSKSFPLLTTRKMFFRGIFEELMFFIRGQTDSKILEEKNIAIWKANTTKEFLQSRNLPYNEGDMGHTYGFSLRNFGAKYIDCNTEPFPRGFDQLQYVINEIKTNPTSRRLVISLWEPNHFEDATLPPCLYGYQFYVEDDELSCIATQRSSDIVVAGGWNIAFSSLFLVLIASVTNLKPKNLIWNVGDIHIYENNIEAANEQLSRKCYEFPTLKLIDPPKDITKFEFNNLKLENYNCHPKINLQMNA